MLVHAESRMVDAVAKPWSISMAIMRSRWPALSPPITTPIRRRLSRTADITRLKPEALV
jgi:hypothetical protein